MAVSFSTRAQSSSAESEAMEHDRRAGELFESGELEQALHEMQAAQRLLPATARVYNIAVCQDQLGF